MKKLWDTYFDKNLAEKVLDTEEFWAFDNKPEATRSVSGKILNKAKKVMPNLMGGAADLAPSTKTYMEGAGDFLLRIMREAICTLA